MKYRCLLLFALFSFALLPCFAHSNKSKPMNFHIVRGQVPPVLSIVPGSYKFVDQDNNGVIDANERCMIQFTIENTGRGDGYNCIAKVKARGNTEGLVFKDIQLPTIPHGKRLLVEIPITATNTLKTGEIAFNIVVDEPNGYGTEALRARIGTHKLRIPDVQVASYKIVGTNSGTLQRRRPFSLQVQVQNLDQGIAEQVQVELVLPRNVNLIGGEMNIVTIPKLAAGESHTIEYELIANQEAAQEINVLIRLDEKQGLYAKDADIPLRFGQQVSSNSREMVVARHDEDVEIQRQSLTSAVDENIPKSKRKNTTTFAVIIANENYQQVAKVPYALNDGNIFRQYCERTLGIPAQNIHYVADGTLNNIRHEVKWLRGIMQAYGGNAKIIFYYAGHGVPDENSRTAYLLPVDGNGTDASTGYKLDELYSSLGSIKTTSVTIFLDACFSGSKREDGMITSARGVAVKPRYSQPQGNMVVFTAATGEETAYPNKEEGHGMFTYYLLKKLQETEGNVTYEELGDYIYENVKRQSIVLNGKSQSPMIIPSPSANGWEQWQLR